MTPVLQKKRVAADMSYQVICDFCLLVCQSCVTANRPGQHRLRRQKEQEETCTLYVRVIFLLLHKTLFTI